MKKISSEMAIDLPSMKVKWGTINKKNPSFIYLELGTYITPSESQENYSENISQIEKTGRQIFKDAVYGSKDISSNFIFVVDVAETRIAFGKKSYISMQLHIGRHPQKEKENFGEIVADMNKRWAPIYDKVLSAIENNGFSCSKSKN